MVSEHRTASLLTIFVSENSSAYRTWPHPQWRRQLWGHFRMTCQMFAKTSLIDVEFATYRTRMICTSSFGWWHKLEEIIGLNFVERSLFRMGDSRICEQKPKTIFAWKKWPSLWNCISDPRVVYLKCVWELYKCQHLVSGINYWIEFCGKKSF